MKHNLKSLIQSITAVSALTWTGANPVHARSPQSLIDLVTDVESPVGRATRSFYQANPATMGYRDSVSLSGGSLIFDHMRQSRPTMVQTGSGHTNYTLGLNSYYKLGTQSTVWGEADYSKGSICNVSFADCLDYLFVAPYCMGDNVGGNMSTQRYRFGGGWNGTFGKWNIGIEGKYRAEIGHRDHDPRVRDIVSDLDIAIGGSRHIDNRHAIALDLGVKVYHQDCDVKFMNEANTITTLVYSGMGEIFNRFTGNLVSATAYSGSVYKIGVNYMPTDHMNGFYGRIEASKANCDMFLREHNNSKAGYTSTMTGGTTLGWKQNLGNATVLFPTLTISFSQRQGTENLFGSGTETYDIIGSRKIYKHTLAGGVLNIPVEWRITRKTVLTATPSIGWNSDKEQLLNPVRTLKVDYMTAGLSLDGVKNFNKSFVRINMSGYHRNASPGNPVWGGLDTSTPIGTAVTSNYDMLSCNTTTLNASASYGIAVNNFVYELCINYSHVEYKQLAHGNAIMASLSLKF